MAEAAAQQSLQSLGHAFHFVVNSCTHAWEVIGPGGQLHPELFIQSNGHLLLEGLLAVVIGYLLLQRSYKPSSAAKDAQLNEQVAWIVNNMLAFVAAAPSSWTRGNPVLLLTCIGCHSIVFMHWIGVYCSGRTCWSGHAGGAFVDALPMTCIH